MEWHHSVTTQLSTEERLHACYISILRSTRNYQGGKPQLGFQSLKLIYPSIHPSNDPSVHQTFSSLSLRIEKEVEVAGLKEQDLPSSDPPTAAGSSSTLSESHMYTSCDSGTPLYRYW